MLLTFFNATLTSPIPLPLSLLSELEKEVPRAEQRLQSARSELTSTAQQLAEAGEQLRVGRGRLEEVRSALQAGRGRGAVLNAVMEQKRNGSLPGVFGRLVSGFGGWGIGERGLVHRRSGSVDRKLTKTTPGVVMSAISMLIVAWSSKIFVDDVSWLIYRMTNTIEMQGWLYSALQFAVGLLCRLVFYPLS